MTVLPADIARPIIAEAGQARQRQSTFTCSVATAHTDGNAWTARKKKRLQVESYDLGPLIDAIEAHGWTLQSIDHVNVLATSGGSGAMGHSFDAYNSEIVAQLLFRAR